MVNKISVKRLDLTRMVVRITTAVVSVWFVPLAIFTPWSRERIVEDYGFYGSITTVYHFNIYLALSYIIPVVGLLVANGSVKRYLKHIRAETIAPIRISPTETVFIAQNSSKNQQSQQIGEIKIRHCIICGQPNDYNSKFCKYFGNQSNWSWHDHYKTILLFKLLS